MTKNVKYLSATFESDLIAMECKNKLTWPLWPFRNSDLGIKTLWALKDSFVLE